MFHIVYNFLFTPLVYVTLYGQAAIHLSVPLYLALSILSITAGKQVSGAIIFYREITVITSRQLFLVPLSYNAKKSGLPVSLGEKTALPLLDPEEKVCPPPWSKNPPLIRREDLHQSSKRELAMAPSW